MKGTLLAGAALFAVGSTAQALTGNQLYEMCTDPEKDLYCLMYVMGAAEGWDAAVDVAEGMGTQGIQLMSACPPQGHNMRQAVNIVVKFAARKPEEHSRVCRDLC